MLRPTLHLRFGFIALLLAGGLACSNESHRSAAFAPDGQTVALPFHQSVTIPIHGIVNLRMQETTLVFAQAGEGRCPMGALCIRADYVTVDLVVQRHGVSGQVRIGSGYAQDGPVPSQATVEGMTISYVELTPRPLLSGFPDPNSYVVQLTVDGR
jgi:hypothetical protein